LSVYGNYFILVLFDYLITSVLRTVKGASKIGREI